MSKKFVGVQFVETVRTGKNTLAFGIYNDFDIGRVPFAGVSEKNAEDTEKISRGRNFAVGRAFQNLGKEIEKREWAKLKQPVKKEVSAKKLSAKEVAELMNTPEAIKKREERAKKHAKENPKAAKSAVEADSKVGKTKATATNK